MKLCLALICVLLLISQSDGRPCYSTPRSPPGFLLSGSASRTRARSDNSASWSGLTASCTDTIPPEITCPSLRTQYTITSTATVTWAEPTCNDIRSCCTVRRIAGGGPGTQFNEGFHTVTYSIVDTTGNDRTCSFCFSVVVIQCSALEVPSNAFVSCTNRWSVDSVCQIVCNTGFRLSGSASRTCEGSGHSASWSGSAPSCTKDTTPLEITCPSLGTQYTTKSTATVTWAEPTCTDTHSSCSLRLIAGEPPGSQFREGLHTVKYSTADTTGDKRRCSFSFSVVVLRCSVLEVPSNGIVSYTKGRSVGSVCQSACNTGFRLNGSAKRTCIASNNSASWSGSAPSCINTIPPEITCPSLRTQYTTKSTATVTWAEPTCTDTHSSCSVTRIAGEAPGSQFSEGSHHKITYRAVDTAGNDRTCSFSFRVVVLQCHVLEVPLNGIVHCTNGRFVGSVCQIFCNTGFRLSGSASRTCVRSDNLISASWSGSVPSCTNTIPPEIICPALETQYTTKFTATVTWAEPACTDTESSCTVTRIAGGPPGTQFSEGFHTVTYSTDDATGNKRTCSFRFSVVVLRCSVLEVPSNGIVSCTNGRSVDSVCQIVCKTGFRLSGSASRTCEGSVNSSSWSGSASSCTIRHLGTSTDTGGSSTSDASVAQDVAIPVAVILAIIIIVIIVAIVVVKMRKRNPPNPAPTNAPQPALPLACLSRSLPSLPPPSSQIHRAGTLHSYDMYEVAW